MKMSPDDFPQEIRPRLISYLKTLQRRGIKSIYQQAASAPVEAAVHRAHPEAKADGPGDGGVERRLAELDAQVKACTDCRLHEGRTNTVFGKGDPTSRVMFIGEGPGRDEDLQGAPFVGRSGQLLTKMLAAIDLRREDVYITNIVKCRPPENRAPEDDEVRCCEKYLSAQIDAIRPRVICALGRVAAQWLLDTKAPLSELRGAENVHKETPVLVTYHPAALLRNPGLKRDAWDDFKKLRAIIEG
jgi:DNA polymerase